MTNDPSIPSAAGALEALQNRVKELEEENKVLRRDINVLRINLAETERIKIERESKLYKKSDFLSERLEGAADAIHTMRGLRKEKNSLLKLNTQIEKDLGETLRKNAELKIKMEKCKEGIKESTDTIKLYDEMLLEYLIPETHNKLQKTNINFYSTCRPDGGSNSLTVSLQKLIQEIQILPKSTEGHSLEAKKKMFCTLKKAKETLFRLKLDQKLLETQHISQKAKREKSKRITSEILSIQYHLARLVCK